ncbi:IclR family transcriptional regulator [Rhodococcus sp. NPDC058514]|uniref:IclR family transcriptional regulator n=1 Tax=unclassified Rhodococcus (in: high G+C Gram-positive bacteria) TaxID=192944 RepID=UPI003649E31A
MSGDENSPVAVMDRVSILLEAFSDSERLTLSELSRRTGFPRSSTHRMLVQLVRLQWVRRRGQAYELGMKMFELGSLALHHDSVHRAALPIMHQLHATTGLVVHLGVLTGSEVLYLERIGSRFAMSLPSRVGARQPAAFTAVGKAILAGIGADPEELAAEAPNQATPHSISDPEQLRREFARIRERSVAQDRDEAVVGASCVAAAIGNGRTTVGAISVCGPTDKINTAALVAPVRMAALATWRHIAEQRPPRDIPA